MMKTMSSKMAICWLKTLPRPRRCRSLCRTQTITTRRMMTKRRLWMECHGTSLTGSSLRRLA